MGYVPPKLGSKFSKMDAGSYGDPPTSAAVIPENGTLVPKSAGSPAPKPKPDPEILIDGKPPKKRRRWRRNG